MIRRVLALAAIGSVLAGAPAEARDARLTQRLYNAEEVVRIDGRMGVQATVAFADDEHIENVAVGDAESWQITPNKRANLLFVKPLSAAARTNMTVVTDRHTYYFDLIANSRATPVYALKFTYPAEPKSAAGTPGAQAVLTDAERAALNDEAPVDPAQLNFAWRTSGPAKLIPQRLYDDGESTYAVWAAGVPIPAILVTNEKGDEGPVNFAVRGDTIVIDGVPSHIVLRVGRDRAQLDYKGPGPKPKSPPQAPAPATAAVSDPVLPRSE
ncbi:TrbG/VirB9 family P-type conjugative transfer protein [Novosphingobium sp. G106]|uniref:TrbG/VirB9 family P-type conjugative transfer protein n=1 Tax=Novosphingobium sp. G106 TaxID=2849500 RepID=UPI001C2D2CD3|nr:TrbG/VirB9 family P-type conjugative transfer protein [Novosphingobium sp. G106]MBV1690157.1 TrbG/VirB9 family P-type conjugative transfer protein [Novosphingobium sp. G106]